MSQHKAYAEKVLGDKIRFLGRQNDTYKFYLASDIFLMASYAEGYPPNSVNEALAAGLPVLTRKIPGVTDTITDGLNGFHFSSEKEFSAKLSSLIHNKTKRIEMGRNAQIFATDKLNINSIVDRLVTFINAI
jgi:glycosyltransferase involved in cell wall biosynthesis